MQKPLQYLSGLHACPDSGQPKHGPDHGAAKAAGKLQQPADRHVWDHRQVSPRLHPSHQGISPLQLKSIVINIKLYSFLYIFLLAVCFIYVHTHTQMFKHSVNL